jgi:hypothetical protein
VTTQVLAVVQPTAAPGRRVCLGCGCWQCITPQTCSARLVGTWWTPCPCCRGIGAVRVYGPGGGFIECDDCDGLGLLPTENTTPGIDRVGTAGLAVVA